MSVQQYLARALETEIEDEIIAAFRPDMQAWLREQLDEFNGYAAEDYQGGKHD